jgi:hypothetical protein
MVTSLERKRKGIFQELEISISLHIIWKEKVAIQSMTLSLVKLEAIFVMEDIIHFIGKDLGLMGPKLLSILQPLSMDFLNLYGLLREEMQLLLIITLLLISTE